MILQTDKRLLTPIQAGGCHFRSLQGIAEMKAGGWLTTEQINKAYYDLVAAGAMDHECVVKDPDAIANLAFLDLSRPELRARQVGQVWGRVALWAEEFWTILRGFTEKGFLEGKDPEKGEGLHFRLGDRNAALIFDPFPGTPIHAELSAIIYRVRTV